MTIAIEDVREPAVSPENHVPLAELMKFRHFARYYYEIDLDWRKVDYLVDVLREAHPPRAPRPGAVRGVPEGDRRGPGIARICPLWPRARRFRGEPAMRSGPLLIASGAHR